MKGTLRQVRFGGPTAFFQNAMSSLFKSQSTYTTAHTKDRSQIMKLFARSLGLRPAHPTYKLRAHEHSIIQKFTSTWHNLLGLSTENRLKSYLTTSLTTPTSLIHPILFTSSTLTLNRTLTAPHLTSALTHKFYSPQNPDLHLLLTPKDLFKIHNSTQQTLYLDRPKKPLTIHLIPDPKSFILTLEQVESEISEFYLESHIEIMGRVKVGVLA